MSLASKGSPQGTVVLADGQMRGRGRLGRGWHSPPGVNIYMSVILRPDMPAGDVTLLTVLSAVAGAAALRKLAGLGVGLKWPNDLVVSGRKIGGILLESRFRAGRVLFAVIGIGINVNIGAGSFPPDIKEIATSVLIETGREFDRDAVVLGIIDEIEARLGFLQTSPAALIQEWRGLSITTGKRVKVMAENDTVEGLALDIDDRGRLLLRADDNSIRTISAGDVTLLG